MTTLRQAAQDLLDKIDERGASPLDWPEYSELQAALAAPEQEPVATVITHRGGVAISGTSKFPAVGTKLYAAPVEPYDQQALEPCPECCWKTVIPGEPCLMCKAPEVKAPEWTPCAAQMPNPCAYVLAYNGKRQPIRAMWVTAKTLEATGDGDFGEYDEATDEIWWPEGWYETNAYEETHWCVNEPVTHWMPLPQPPKGDKP